MKLGSIEKDRQPSIELMRLFEKTRVAYLSALQDPDEYSGRWRKVVDMIEESFNELDSASKELKNFLREEEITAKEVKDPKSSKAKNLYEKIKLVRYNSKVIADPFAEMFKGSVKDMQPDTITEGLMGLDLEVDDIPLYIIEHYGDGKDSKKVESKVKAALDMLELIFFSQHEEKEWESLKDIDMQKAETKSETEKSISDFLVPNKPMYRIFDIDDIKELKGFSGEWYVQEKYDGMRIQLHKIDNKIKIYSYNKKDITDRCEEIVKELKKKEYGDCIFDAELILFDGDEPLHRADTISHVFKGKYKEAKLKCHVFDIMRHEAQTLLDEELENRMTTLFNNYSAKSSEYLNFPSKKDTRQADNLKDLEEYSKEIMEMPTSEGVVIKDATSTYYVGTKKNPKWIKWKKFVDLDVIVLDKKKTKSNLYSYTVGVGPIPEEMNGKEIDGKKYLNVGKALNTKVAEIPEVEHPDKLVTLELLSKDTKKSLNYNVEALKKGVMVTDYIHGETTAIIKFDTDGFVIYGFEENNLMSKNALRDIDMWKAQAEEIMKTKQGELTVIIVNYLQEKGDKTPKEVHDYLNKDYSELYETVLDSKLTKVGKWAQEREHISMVGNKLHADPSIKLADGEEIKKEYKTPDEYRNGEFKIYNREDNNIHLAISVNKENLNWTIDLEDEKELFDLFGAAGKYPAEVSKNVERGKVIDSGNIELGVQKDGYHEYFLKGNKFETKMHIRVIPIDNKPMWLAWTGYKQEPADTEGDEGKWNIYEDRYNKLSIPTED